MSMKIQGMRCYSNIDYLVDEIKKNCSALPDSKMMLQFSNWSDKEGMPGLDCVLTGEKITLFDWAVADSIYSIYEYIFDQRNIPGDLVINENTGDYDYIGSVDWVFSLGDLYRVLYANPDANPSKTALRRLYESIRRLREAQIGIEATEFLGARRALSKENEWFFYRGPFLTLDDVDPGNKEDIRSGRKFRFRAAEKKESDAGKFLQQLENGALSSGESLYEKYGYPDDWWERINCATGENPLPIYAFASLQKHMVEYPIGLIMPDLENIYEQLPDGRRIRRRTSESAMLCRHYLVNRIEKFRSRMKNGKKSDAVIRLYDSTERMGLPIEFGFMADEKVEISMESLIKTNEKLRQMVERVMEALKDKGYINGYFFNTKKIRRMDFTVSVALGATKKGGDVKKKGQKGKVPVTIADPKTLVYSEYKSLYMRKKEQENEIQCKN